jgi:pyruvate,water dikinase
VSKSNAVGLFAMEHLPNIIWFKESASFSTSVVGEKGVDLGRLQSAQLPIPGGFVIPSHVFSSLLTEDLKHRIDQIFSQIQEHIPATLTQASDSLKQLVMSLRIPDEVAREIARAYHQLGNQEFVAVRSSKSQPRLPTVHATYLNIQGDASVVDVVKKVWSALYDPKVLLSLYQNLLSPSTVSQAVVIERMTQSRVSGVAYTKNPTNNNKRTIVIDAIWGLGDYLADHIIQADRYEIEKDTWEVIQQNRHAQDQELVRRVGKTETIKVPDTRKFSPKLTPEELKLVAQLALKVQQFLFFPQRIEWSLENNQLFILQTEQLVETVGDNEVPSMSMQTGTMRPILYGSSVQGGLISGKVRVCRTEHEYHTLQPGEILVTKKLGMLYLEKIRKAAGIIADEPIFPRDVQSLGLPCVGNTHFGTAVLKTGQVITMYGQQGTVYDGTLEYSTQKSTSTTGEVKPTKLYLSIGEPNNIHKVPLEEISGVGLLRAEYMFASTGIHPKKLLHERKENLLIHSLREGMKNVCQAVHPKPVYYRFLDMTSADLRSLDGGDQFEPEEVNPVIGYRGPLRYLTDLAVFNLEIEAIAELKREGFDNLHIMVPFVRSVEELVLIKSHLAKHGLTQSSRFQMWMMIDTPAVALTLDNFFSHGVDGVAIGSRDLLMLLLGLDPELSTSFSQSYSNAPAFHQIVEHIVQTAKKFQKPVIFCEHVLNQQLLEFLATVHVDGISVNAKQIPFIKRMLKN